MSDFRNQILNAKSPEEIEQLAKANGETLPAGAAQYMFDNRGSVAELADDDLEGVIGGWDKTRGKWGYAKCDNCGKTAYGQATSAKNMLGWFDFQCSVCQSTSRDWQFNSLGYEKDETKYGTYKS